MPPVHAELLCCSIPWELHRTNSNSPSAGCWKTGVISAGAPEHGENSWLAQQMLTSRLPSQLEVPIDFSEAGMLVGKRGGGRRKP